MAINTISVFFLLLLTGTAIMDQDVEFYEKLNKPQLSSNSSSLKHTTQKLVEEINQANKYMADISNRLEKDVGFPLTTILPDEMIDSSINCPKIGLTPDVCLKDDVPDENLISSPEKKHSLSPIQLPAKHIKRNAIEQSTCKANESLTEMLPSTCAKKKSQKKRERGHANGVFKDIKTI